MSEAWSTYYEKTRNNPPSKLLVEAIPFVHEHGTALDVGAGALKDSRYLLKQGFEVTAFDSVRTFTDEARTVQSEKFHPVAASFESFNYPISTFDLVNTINALPLISDNLESVVSKLIASLKPGGIFCGTFFGPNDEWNTPDSGQSFRSLEQVRSMFAGLELVVLREEDKDRPTAAGAPKHWHIIYVIARR